MRPLHRSEMEVSRLECGRSAEAFVQAGSAEQGCKGRLKIASGGIDLEIHSRWFLMLGGLYVGSYELGKSEDCPCARTYYLIMKMQEASRDKRASSDIRDMINSNLLLKTIQCFKAIYTTLICRREDWNHVLKLDSNYRVAYWKRSLS